MKKILLLLILMCSMVYAEEGEIEVDSFKAYIDGEGQSLNWDDDLVLAKPGDTIQLRLRLENNYDYDIEVEIEGLLELFDTEIERDNIEDDDDDKEIRENSRKYYVLGDYYLPESLEYGLYDFEIEYSYEANHTTIINSTHNKTELRDYEHRTRIDLELRRPKKPVISQDDIFLNLTRDLASTNRNNTLLLTELARCSNVSKELSACQLIAGKYNESAEYKPNWEKCNAELIELTSNSSSCESKIEQMFSATQLNQAKDKARLEGRRTQKELADKNVLIFIVIGVAYYLYNKKKKEAGGQGTGVSLRGSTWK